MAPAEILDADDLRRKLAIAEAHRAYDLRCAESQLLEAAESERKLLVRLAFAEPQYEALREEHALCKQYIDELEETIEQEKMTAQQQETVVKQLRSEYAIAKGQVKAINEELRDIKSSDLSSAAQLIDERNSALSSLGDLRREHQLLKEHLPALEEQVAQLSTIKAAKSELEKTLKSVRAELAAAKKEDEKRRKSAEKSAENDKVEQRRQVVELEEQLVALRHELDMEKRTSDRQRETAVTNADTAKSYEKELAEVRAQAKKEGKARERAERDLEKAMEEWASKTKVLESKIEALSKQSSKANQKESTDLRAQLNKETKLREKAEQELAKATEEWVAKHKALESKVDTTKSSDKELSDIRAQLKKEVKAREKAERELNRATEDWESKNKVLESKLENTRAKLRKATSAGENAKKRSSSVAGLTMQDLERSVKKPRQKTPPKMSELSMTPFLKHKATIVAGNPDDTAADTPTAEHRARVEEHPGDRTMIMPSVIESAAPTRMLLAGANRNRKRKAPPAAPPVQEEAEEPRPKAKTKAPEPEPEPAAAEEIEEEDSFMLPPPPKTKARVRQRQNKKTSAGLPPKVHQSLLSSSPAAAPVVKEAPKPKAKAVKKKKAGETSFVGGIRPTLFDEDDGTGRLNLNIGGDSQEPGKVVPLLVPKVGSLTKDISPPKKRPAGLKNIFAGKK